MDMGTYTATENLWPAGAWLQSFVFPVVLLLSIDFVAGHNLLDWIAIKTLQPPPESQVAGDGSEGSRWKPIIIKKSWFDLGIALTFAAIDFSLPTFPLAFRQFVVMYLSMKLHAWLGTVSQQRVVIHRQAKGFAVSVNYRNYTDVAAAIPIWTGGLFIIFFAANLSENAFTRIGLQLLCIASYTFGFSCEEALKPLNFKAKLVQVVLNQALLVIAFCGILHAALGYSTQAADRSDLEAEPDSWWASYMLGAFDTSSTLVWFTWETLYTIPLTRFLSACMRFDYHQYITASQLSGALAHERHLETVPPLEGVHPSLATGPGVIVPPTSRRSLSFFLPRARRTYYHCAFGIAVAGYMLIGPVVHLIIKIWLLADRPQRSISVKQAFFVRESAGLLTTFIVTLMVVASTLALAWHRKQSDQLWAFQEKLDHTKKSFGNHDTNTPAFQDEDLEAKKTFSECDSDQPSWKTP